jgi:hypothetical protein
MRLVAFGSEAKEEKAKQNFFAFGDFLLVLYLSEAAQISEIKRFFSVGAKIPFFSLFKKREATYCEKPSGKQNEKCETK